MADNPLELPDINQAAFKLLNTNNGAVPQQTLGSFQAGAQPNTSGIPQPQQINSLSSVGNGVGIQDNVSTLKNNADYWIQKDKDYLNTAMGKAEPYIKGASSIASTFGSLANIYLGFQQLGMMKDQLGMAKEQWQAQKQELAHVRTVRKNLTAQYMA